jgi:hypothetical protein
MTIDFIGLGAQKSGTSWVYACLCDHKEVCAPVKELHFFSRQRFDNGRGWYENHFSKCGDKVKGEFSTSYLYSKETPQRIKSLYPEVRLIAILRNPVDRAISQYKNALKGGHIKSDLSFEAYMTKDASVVGQGLYHEQLERYLQYFPREQILVLIYEDIKKDPQAFISKIFKHIGVDDTFVPSMLNAEVNVARTPRFIILERIMHHVSEFLRRIGFSSVVHAIRKSGLPDLVRFGNTKEERPLSVDREKLAAYFTEDAQKLSMLLERDVVHEWGL